MKLLTKKDITLTKQAINRINELKCENSEVFIRVMITTGG